MTRIGPTIHVRGEIECAEDLTIAGRVDGPVSSLDHLITVTTTGAIAGDILARDVTILGRVAGTVVATQIVDVRQPADVSGRILSPRFILHDGGCFNGSVEPQRLEAALQVAGHRRRARTLSQ